MKTDGDIKTDVFNVIKGSRLAKTVTGKLSKRGRPFGSDKEDIVVSVLENEGSYQIQEAFVNVNIYVKDQQNTETKGMEINDNRVNKLSRMAVELLKDYNGGVFRFERLKQRVLKVEGKNEHVINNRILYKQSNE